MKIKDYYRLAELQEVHGISIHDLRYAIEQDQITLAIRVNSTKLLIAKWANGKVTAYGLALYSGLLILPRSTCRELIEKAHCFLDTFFLPAKRIFESFSSQFPFDIPTPNNLIEKWVVVKEEQLPQSELPVILMPTESIGAMKAILAALKQSEQAKQHPERVLRRNLRKITMEDVVITSTELEKLKGGVTEAADKTEKNSPLLSELPFKNDFHRLLATTYLAMNKPKAKEIFLALERDLLKEEDSREFDHDNVLLDSTGEKLVWHDRFSTKDQKEVSPRTLENELVKVKKLLKEHNIK